MQKKLTAFIQTIQDVVIIINRQGIIQFCNPSIKEVLGYEPDELVGQNVSVLMGYPHKSRHDAYLHQHNTTGVKKIIGIGREVIAIHKNGEKIPVRLNVSPLEIDGEHLYMGMLYDLTNHQSLKKHIATINTGLEAEIEARNQDLTKALDELTKNRLVLEQKIIETQLAEERLLAAQKNIEKALKKERELNELKTRFISTASHEFRTPLSSILSSASLIERYTTTETNKNRLKHVNRIKSSVQNLTEILNDFLSLSKLEEGKVAIGRQLFNLEDVIINIIEEISVSAKKNQTFDYQHTGDNNLIHSNLQSVKNILINLLSNAVKYSGEQSSVYIRSNVTEAGVLIEVQDEGMGIPPEQQPFLFTRFFRADNATNIQGTGLGLFIVQKYLENLNGSISFTSELNKGTTFSINIPNEQPA